VVTVVTHVSHSITFIVWTLFHGGDVVATCELVSFVVLTYYFYHKPSGVRDQSTLLWF